MKFSIVTPNYNYGRFLKKALESVLAQVDDSASGGASSPSEPPIGNCYTPVMGVCLCGVGTAIASQRHLGGTASRIARRFAAMRRSVSAGTFGPAGSSTTGERGMYASVV